MATITESIALHSFSSSPRALLQPKSTSRPGTSVSFGRTSFPGLRGLKVSHLSSTPAIVSQSQDTVAVDIPTVTDKTWKSLVLNADGPVLVEFWAPWCGPCRMFHPVVGEIANEYTGKLNCFRISTDDSPSIATRYGIRSVPTIMIFNKGEKKDAVIGAVRKITLTSSIEKYL